MQNTYKINQLLLDVDSGEVVKEIREGDKVYIHKPMSERQQIGYIKMLQMKEQRNELQKLINDHCGQFFFYFFKNMEELTMKEIYKIRFLFLSTYVNYTSKGNYITYDNGVKIDKNGLIRLLKLGSTEARSTIKQLCQNELLIEDSGFYKINEDICKKGILSTKDKADTYSRVFGRTLRVLYVECESSRHKQLYWFFKMLPNVSIKFNAICGNPEEQNAKLIEPFRIQDICKLVGYNCKNLKRFETELYKFRIANQRVILGIKNEEGVWFKVNPRLYYQGTFNDLQEFKDLISADFSI